MLINMENAVLERVIESLTKAFKSKGIKKKKDMAVFLGYTPPHFSNVLSGTGKLTDDFLHKISDSLLINYQWLKTGEGEMFVQPPTANNTINNSGDFCENIIGGDLQQQLAELITIQKKFQDMMSVKDKQINDLIEILKGSNKKA